MFAWRVADTGSQIQLHLSHFAAELLLWAFCDFDRVTYAYGHIEDASQSVVLLPEESGPVTVTLG